MIKFFLSDDLRIYYFLISNISILKLEYNNIMWHYFFSIAIFKYLSLLKLKYLILK